MSDDANSKYEEAKKLYACLENIAKSNDDDASDETDKFDTFFQKWDDTGFLFSNDLLQSQVTDVHRIGPKNMSGHVLEINGKTLLLRAMSISSRIDSNKRKHLERIIDTIVEHVPEMVTEAKEGSECAGITPLHIAILKQDVRLLGTMRQAFEEKGHVKDLEGKVKEINANGEKIQNSVLMAGTPLGVAALKFNTDIFKIILKDFCSDLGVKNSRDDNILHSLIKYVHFNPNYLNETVEMLNFILSAKWNQSLTSRDAREETKKLIFQQNIEGLNPLQLAAKRQQFDVFDLILKCDTYRSTESSDGLFDAEEYDITEIDTFAPPLDVVETKTEKFKGRNHESILEYVVMHPTSLAFAFADSLPVREVIRNKWKFYRWPFWIWFLFHLVFMCLLTYTALRRSKLTKSAFENGISPEVEKPIYINPVEKDDFVGIVGVIIGVCFLLLELSRRIIIRRFQAKTSSIWYIHWYRRLTLPHSSSLFEVYFVIFFLCLVTDFALSVSSIDEYENYCLILALIVGWYLVMFFIQTFKPFSFFTVLIQRVTLDLVRFSFVMAILLVAFSAAMSMVMQGASTSDEDFDHFGKTMVKMLTIMLGIGELSILFNARHPILAVVVFVWFVLLTTILLLNSLIALMSNSCTDLMSSQRGVVATKMHGRLQKLSVILFLESYLPRKICKEVGTIKATVRHIDHRSINRRFLSQSSIQNQDFDDVTKTETFNTTQLFPSLVKTLKDKTKKRKQRKIDLQPEPRRQEKNVEIMNIEADECNTCKQHTSRVKYTQQISIP